MSNKPLIPSSTKLLVGARTSPLSRTQVQEVSEEMRNHHPHIQLEPLWVSTTGDKDLKTTLRTMDKTNFFTKEIDNFLLAGKCRIGVHSAKDLPKPLPKGLCIVAVTKGVNPSDSLVFREGETLESLPSGAKIATSSERREAAVKQLRPDLQFMDLRGTIDQRLKKLDNGDADGIVIAEAALIRLGLTHVNRITLPGETVPGQGQLAILAKEEDTEIEALFSCIDTRRKTLYLGLEPPQSDLARKIVPYPLIKIAPRDPQSPEIEQPFRNIRKYTHIIFTSKTTVNLFFEILYDRTLLNDKTIIAVGTKTANRIRRKGVYVDIIPHQETAEGIVEELKKLSLEGAYCFWPHSALSRPFLTNYFQENQIAYEEAVLYDVYPHQPGPLPDLNRVDEIYFTSPSTVDAFLHFFGEFPTDKTLTPVGPVTAEYLRTFFYCLSASSLLHSDSSEKPM